MLMFTISITACSSKLHVRLFTDNLSEKDLAQIEKKFKSSNVLFSLSNTEIPKSITDNSILYTPSIDSNQKIYHIIDLLGSAGFDISWTTILRVENHSFTADNMGLYLFSDGLTRELNEKSSVELNEYSSVECGSNLSLNDDLTFNVIFDIWDAGLEDYREISVTGEWRAKGAADFELNSESWQTKLLFKKRINIESRPEGNLKTVSLEPIYNSEKSGFYLKVPDSQPDINCSYQINIFN